jgi:hypothetical protein
MHKVHIFRNGAVITHPFTDAKEAVKFYYLSHVEPAEKSHIELTPSDYIFWDFFPPKVIDFSGTFVNEYFVGECTIESSDASREKIEGVFYMNELDFSKWNLQKANESVKIAISGLMLSGAREIGRNDNTCQTFLLYGDNMIAVDDLGQIRVSPKCSSWNECIDELTYDYQNYNNETEYEAF